MHRTLASLIVAIAAVSAATPAIAQVQSSGWTRPKFLMRTPRAEATIFAGIWSLDHFGESGTGGRLTLNRASWLSTEVSLDTRGRTEYGPAETLLIANARFFGRDPLTGTSGFVTAGVASGVGVRRTVAPMVGLGGQGMWRGSIAGARVELQYFLGGAMHRNNDARLLVGFAFEIP